MDTHTPQKTVCSIEQLVVVVLLMNDSICEPLWLQAMCILTLGPLAIVMASLWEVWTLRENLVSVSLHFSNVVFNDLSLNSKIVAKKGPKHSH